MGRWSKNFLTSLENLFFNLWFQSRGLATVAKKIASKVAKIYFASLDQIFSCNPAWWDGKKFIPCNLLGSQWFQWVDEANFFWPHLKISFSTYDFSLVGWLGSRKKLWARLQKYISQAWIRFFLATFDQNFFWLIPCQKNLIQARPKKFRELACKFFGVAVRVKLAERSKAPDLSSGSHKRAWVRTPHLTNLLAGSVFKKGQLVMLWGALSIGLCWTPRWNSSLGLKSWGPLWISTMKFQRRRQRLKSHTPSRVFKFIFISRMVIPSLGAA